jgi:hypothetical protein
MQHDSHLPFELPAVARKKVSIAFDGGMLSSNAGVLLLRGVEARCYGQSNCDEPILLCAFGQSTVGTVLDLFLDPRCRTGITDQYSRVSF